MAGPAGSWPSMMVLPAVSSLVQNLVGCSKCPMAVMTPAVDGEVVVAVFVVVVVVAVVVVVVVAAAAVVGFVADVGWSQHQLTEH